MYFELPRVQGRWRNPLREVSCAGAQLVRELSAAVAVVMANLPAAEGSIPPTAAVNLNIFYFSCPLCSLCSTCLVIPSHLTCYSMFRRLTKHWGAHIGLTLFPSFLHLHWNEASIDLQCVHVLNFFPNMHLWTQNIPVELSAARDSFTLFNVYELLHQSWFSVFICSSTCVIASFPGLHESLGTRLHVWVTPVNLSVTNSILVCLVV